MTIDNLTISNFQSMNNKSSDFSYPENMALGNTLFPLLYLFYHGSDENRALIGDQELMQQGLIKYMEQTTSMGEASSTINSGDNKLAVFTRNVPKLYKMFLAALKKNDQYLWMLTNHCAQVLSTYKSRIPVRNGNFYVDEVTGKSSYYPVLRASDSSALKNCMEVLRVLYENNVIQWDYNFGIRAIHLETGDFIDSYDESSDLTKVARDLGIPQKGMFTINKNRKTDFMYHTFSGIDITAVASLSDVVTPLEGMTQISWSVYRPKTPTRTLGKINAAGRVAGSRTIAGTMIFTLFDHHPLHDIIPDDMYANQKPIASQSSRLWKPKVMADQIPPFDLVIILQNEYGFASVVTLYGISIVNESSVVGMDNMVTELVCEYVAAGMDPITQVEMDEFGNVDPYGLMNGNSSDFWRNRDIVISGVAYSDLEQAYEAQYDAKVSTIGRIKS